MRAALVVAALAGSATAAAAQRAPASEPAFSVERFTPAPGSALWIGVEDADVPAAGRWVVTGSTWIASRPIVLRALSTGAESTEPVRLRWGQEVAVARGLGARYLVGLAVPAALQWGDRLAGIGLSEAPLARAVLGDLRLHGRARVGGAPGAPGLAAAGSPGGRRRTQPSARHDRGRAGPSSPAAAGPTPRPALASPGAPRRTRPGRPSTSRPWACRA